MKLPQVKVQTYLLCVILILAAVLRFNHINQPYVDAFSWRQTSTAMMADNYYRTNWNIFFPEVSWGGPGPNYQGRELQTVSYLAALLYRIVGQQDWVGRSVAVMFSLWGIFAFHQLVRHIWDDKRALASTTMLALLPGGIFIDRSFLPDPVMVSLVITSFWLFVLHLKTEQQRYLVLVGLLGTWGFLTKITGLMICIPMLYAMLTILRHKQQLTLRKLWPIGVTMLLVLSIVIVYYLWARHLALHYPPYHFAGAHNWIWVRGWGDWIYNSLFLPKLWHHAHSWLWTMPVMILAGLGLLLASLQARQSKDDIKLPWAFHTWLLGAIVYYLIGAQELVDNPWNFHLFNPMIAGFAGFAVVEMMNFVAPSWQIHLPQYLPRYFSAQISRRAMPALMVMTILLVTIVGVGHTSLSYMYKLPWGKESYWLGLKLRQVSQPGDLVVTMASDLGSPNAIYYSHRRGWTFPLPIPDTDWSRLPDDDEESIQMFDKLRAQGADWLGIAEQRKQDFWLHHPKLVAYIKATCDYQTQDASGVIYRILPSVDQASQRF